MKSDKLFDAIGEARSAYLKDAEATPAVRRYGWVKWAAVAACVLVAVLIAVPTLWGKAPEVESNEPTPVEEPSDNPTEDPTDNPTDTPAENPTDNPESSQQESGGVIVFGEGPIMFGDDDEEPDGWDKIRTFTSYAEFSAYTEDPIFEAFSNTEEAQQHMLTYIVYAPGMTETGYTGDLAYIQIFVDAIPIDESKEDPLLGRIGEVPGWSTDELTVTSWYADDQTVNITHQFDTTENLRDSNDLFAEAEEAGVLTSYEIDGIEIQRFFYMQVTAVHAEQVGKTELAEAMRNNAAQPLYERLKIDGEWYYVFGRDETKTDAVVTALAHIAAQM